MFMVITEIVGESKTERWFYGKYDNQNRANEGAMELGNDYTIFHSVILADKACDFCVLNCP